MLTVTQRCGSCGGRVVVEERCPTCAPRAGLAAQVLARGTATWLALAATVLAGVRHR